MNCKKGKETSVAEFRKEVWAYYRAHGRHSLPWRHTRDPYHILLSEVMLQQTQVNRVIEKYELFLEKYPKIERLAVTPLASVIADWQGLGYNRRARLLHECAKEIVRRYKRRVPETAEELVGLPGIGQYTASAILVFAHGQSVPMLETNIKTVYLHHFFSERLNVTEKELFSSIEVSLPKNRVREWFWALMDYGAYIKKTVGNQNVRAKGYATQSRFTGSLREARGAILKVLVETPCTRHKLQTKLTHIEKTHIETALIALCKDRMIVQRGRMYTLAT